MADKNYTVSMRFFVSATPAPKPKTKESKQVAYFYAGLLIVMVLCQLFTFDGFLTYMESLWLPISNPMTHLLTGLIVTAEVFALPFLLGLKLSPLMRFISMVCGWFVPSVWLFLSLWINLTTNNITNAGFLGSLVDVVPGWWAVFLSASFAILAAWASWGMWPFKSQPKIKG